jgi:hypothetical protein
VSFVGFETYNDEIYFGISEAITRNFSLRPTTITGEEVVVESERPRSAITTAGLQTIRPEQLEMVPVPDISGDLMGYLQILPGMFTGGDRGGQLFVRGGTPSQNLTLLDGMPVYQPFHIIGFFSSFPAEIIRQSDVYAGGFGARYGGRVSSVIDITTRNGNKKGYEGSASIAPFLTALHFEGPLVEDRASVLISLRESLIERLFPETWSGAEPFRFGDQFVKVHTNMTDGSQLSATALLSHDRGRVDETEAYRTDDIDAFLGAASPALPEEEIGWSNNVYGFRYFTLPEGNTLTAEINGSISLLRNWAGPIDDPERRSRLWSVQSSATLTSLFQAIEIRWGANIEMINVSYDLDGVFQDFDSSDDNYVNAGPFVETFWSPTSTVKINPGMHVHVFSGANNTVRVEPRLRLSWQPFGTGSLHEFSAAWGLYHQNLVGLKDDRDAGDVFTAWVFTPYRSTIPGAMHVLAGWQYYPSRNAEVGVEAYYRALSNLSVPAWSPYPKFTTSIISADGEVKGVDLRMSIDTGRIYAFLGYGLQDVSYRARQGSFGVWYGTTQESYHPPHDRRHQVNLLLSLDLGAFDADLRWEYGSGLPFTRPLGFDDWILFETLVDVKTDPGEYRVAFEKPYQGRLPAYHRLDLSLKRKWEFARADLTLQGGVINGYDRDNLFYYDVWTLRRVNQMSLMPTVGIKVETR